MSSYLRWRAFCEDEACGWARANVESRDAAIAAGNHHVKQKHRNDERWSYRVQGIRIDVGTQPARPAHPGRLEHAPHQWEPHKTSRNKGAPCGRCGVYRYAHADLYEYTETLPPERRAAILAEGP